MSLLVCDASDTEGFQQCQVYAVHFFLFIVNVV